MPKEALNYLESSRWWDTSTYLDLLCRMICFLIGYVKLALKLAKKTWEYVGPGGTPQDTGWCAGRGVRAGLPNPWATAQCRTGSGPRSARNWASQQDVSAGGWVKLHLYLQPLPPHLCYRLNSTPSPLAGRAKILQKGAKPTVNREARGHPGGHASLWESLPKHSPPPWPIIQVMPYENRP